MPKLLHISDSNDKLGSAGSVSLRPIADCGENCSHCAKKCYAMKFYRARPSVRNAWDANSRAFRDADNAGDWSVLRAEIDAYLQRRRTMRFFRIHVSGDFLSQSHVDFWRSVARAHKSVKFLAFTKRFDLSFANLSPNLSIVFSMWPGMPDTAPKGPRCWVQDGTETRVPPTAIECQGSCESCGMCWSLRKLRKDVVIHIH